MATVTVTAADGGRFNAYLARPAAGSGPGILVIQEIFGVNAVMRQICDDLAAQGYVALCPDLFWRQEPGVDITDKSQAEWDKAFALFNGFNETAGVEDLIASLATLRDLPECTGRAGAIGYCLGGRLAFLMATRSDADCAVSYYGVGIDKLLGEAPAITRPLLLHIAEKDRFVPPEAQDQIRARMASLPTVAVHTYPGLDHAFARVGGEHYDAAGATLANDRTAAFLKTHLG
ncbi:dienelactone hydrolase family protein [Inquilinus limosus]|uniref:Carboxymethylenebutenolidase n=1 Tax=Inquilinus limosus MP06 TaxID=1398085 RepID=A0A0A0D340_9PROT|nr:dienelactone hydrolase family protein [Inquilinus limosus]KGM33136.1 carboxymethylenebutenolidase [Inquilinus limosus MP06]